MQQDEKDGQKHDIKAIPTDEYRVLEWPTPSKEGVVISSSRGVLDTEDNESHNKAEESED